MTRIVIAALALCAIAACGGKSGTLTLNLVTSPADDPFVDAATVRFTVGAMGEHVTTVPVTSGHFTYKVSFKPDDMTGPCLIEALDTAGTVVAHGQTPYLLLSAVDQGPISAWIGRPGRVAPAAAALPKAVTETASAYVPGLGVLYAGGRDATGAALADTAVYDVFTHAVISTAPMEKARAGAVAAPVTGVDAVVYGGASSAGFGMASAVEGTLELFDPTVGIGVWAALPVDTFPARAYSTKVILPAGGILVTGGIDATGTAQTSAGLIANTSGYALTTFAGPMAAGRVGHAAAAVTFPDGAGAILFGGLPSGVTGPVAERVLGQTFAQYDVGAQDNRINATATTMPNGDVLILGGKTPTGGAQASGLVITPTVPAATVTPLPMALSVAREGHTATLTGNDLVVCGGADATGMAQASCDVLDAMTYGRKSTVPLAVARRGHTAEAMETGVVVIAGGVGSDGAPLASIEIYTP
jgi:hypothetical protein